MAQDIIISHKFLNWETDIIGLTFFWIDTKMAHIINKNSNESWVMIHHSSQYFGMVYIAIAIQTATQTAFIPSKTFCLSVATKR